MTQSYDIIGDIHGHYEPLKQLLEHLGYHNDGQCYRHPERLAVFLGDFIDRGPEQRSVIETVKAMIDNNSALAVMGNHEFNALCFHTEDPDRPGTYLRPRSNKNIGQHISFLNEYIGDPADLDRVLSWFKTLPMWLELDGIRIIHACWDPSAIEFIKQNYDKSGLITDDLIINASRKGSDAFCKIETILKGKEISLPEDHKGIPDKMGITRHEIRVKWWDKNIKTYKDAYMGPDFALTHIPDDEIVGDHLVTYSEGEPPVFLGHYWLEGRPERLANNIACTDYSVAKEDGKLVAYRWDGEPEIDNEKFDWYGK